MDTMDTKRCTLKVEGMMCMHCEARVREALAAVDGVENALADREKGEAAADYRAPATPEALRRAVEDAGYQVAEIC